jgi:hypothetical protein
MKSLVASIAVVGILVAGVLAWTAAEHHYANCIDAAQARNPIPQQTDVQLFRDEEAPVRAQRRLVEQVNGCSRLP